MKKTAKKAGRTASATVAELQALFGVVPVPDGKPKSVVISKKVRLSNAALNRLASHCDAKGIRMSETIDGLTLVVCEGK